MPTDTIKSNKIFYKHPVLRLYVFSTRCFFFSDILLTNRYFSNVFSITNTLLTPTPTKLTQPSLPIPHYFNFLLDICRPIC